MEKQSYLVVYYDGNQNKVAIKESDYPESSVPRMWGFPDDFLIIAVIQPADVIADTTVWIDEEEQVFHQ